MTLTFWLLDVDENGMDDEEEEEEVPRIPPTVLETLLTALPIALVIDPIIEVFGAVVLVLADVPVDDVELEVLKIPLTALLALV